MQSFFLAGDVLRLVGVGEVYSASLVEVQRSSPGAAKNSQRCPSRSRPRSKTPTPRDLVVEMPQGCGWSSATCGISTTSSLHRTPRGGRAAWAGLEGWRWSRRCAMWPDRSVGKSAARDARVRLAGAVVSEDGVCACRASTYKVVKQCCQVGFHREDLAEIDRYPSRGVPFTHASVGRVRTRRCDAAAGRAGRREPSCARASRTVSRPGRSSSGGSARRRWVTRWPARSP